MQETIDNILTITIKYKECLNTIIETLSMIHIYLLTLQYTLQYWRYFKQDKLTTHCLETIAKYCIKFEKIYVGGIVHII